MKIEINNGIYTRDNEVAGLLTSSEDQYIAALAQKLIIRKEHLDAKELKHQEAERQKELKRQEKERLKLEKEKERERLKREQMNRLLNGDTF